MLDSRNRALELNVAAAWKRSVRSVRFSKAPQQVKMGHQEIVGVLRELVVLCRAFGVDLQRRFRCIKGRYRVVAGVWGRQMAKGRYRTIPAYTRRLMTKPIVRDPIYRRRRFDAEIIELCVRWYITYRLSYRDLVAMMAERGIAVSHTTIHRWVIRYVPEFEKRWNRFARPVNTSWRVDETYIKIRGKWNYLYRAVDKHGKTVDFLLRPDRGIAAAQASFRKALSSNFPRWPRKITLDGYVPSACAMWTSAPKRPMCTGNAKASVRDDFRTFEERSCCAEFVDVEYQPNASPSFSGSPVRVAPLTRWCPANTRTCERLA